MRERLLVFLWPPVEARRARKSIESGAGERTTDTYEKLRASIERELQGQLGWEGIGEGAREAETSESHRIASVEGKAGAFLFALSVAVGAVSAIPALFGQSASLGVVVAYVLGAVHLFSSVFHAVKARRIGTYILPSGSQVLVEVADGRTSRKARIVSRLARLKFNEVTIRLKVNDLVVAERMFLRGAAFLLLAVMILFASRLTETLPSFLRQPELCAQSERPPEPGDGESQSGLLQNQAE